MKSLWQWIIGVSAALFVIVMGAIWYFGRNWKPIVETKLKEVVQNATNGLYELHYDDLDLNIAIGNVTLRNAELIPDSAVYQQMILFKNAPNNRFHIRLKSLKVKRFNLLDILSHKKLNIKSITFEEPSVHLIYQHHAFNDTISDQPPKTLYESVKDMFQAINVTTVQAQQVKFKYSSIENNKTSDIELANVAINIHDVLLDETSIRDSTRFFYTKMVDVKIPDFEYELSDGFYKIKFDELRINTRDGNILFTKFIFQPKMNKASYFKLRKQDKTMAQVRLDTLRLEHLNFRRLVDNKQIIASKMQIKNGRVDLSNDKRYPKYPINKIGSSPHQQLLKLETLLKLDTVLVRDVSVVYHQFSEKYSKEGYISFDHVSGALTNVTNDTLQLRQNKYMRADLSAKVMNSGRLHAKFSFDMLSDVGYHTYSGALGGMQATSFNKILTPLLNVEMASGNIRGVSFDMKGTDRKNWGSFKFDYDDLKINLLHQPDDGEQKVKKVTSFIINELLINNSNPDKDGNYLTGKVDYTRVPEHTFFKTLWQSLLEGIKQCTGISKEREEKLMGTAEKAKDIAAGAGNVVKKTGKFFKNLFKKDKETD